MKKVLVIGILTLRLLLLEAQVLDKKVSISMDNMPLTTILDQLSNQTAVQFTFDKNRIPAEKRFSLNVQNRSLQVVLSQLFQNTNIQFKSLENLPKTKEKLMSTLANCNLKSAEKLFNFTP